MATPTTNYNLLKPAVNDPSDQDVWGGELNGNMDKIDTQLKLTDTKAANAATAAALRPMRVYVEDNSRPTTTAVIPFADSAPLITDGYQLITATLPSLTLATSKVRVSVFVPNYAINPSSGDYTLFGALFVNGTCSQTATSTPVRNALNQFSVSYEYAPGATAAQTAALRVGTFAGLTIGFNGNFGGTSKITMTIEEIFV